MLLSCCFYFVHIILLFYIHVVFVDDIHWLYTTVDTLSVGVKFVALRIEHTIVLGVLFSQFFISGHFIVRFTLSNYCSQSMLCSNAYVHNCKFLPLYNIHKAYFNLLYQHYCQYFQQHQVLPCRCCCVDSYMSTNHIILYCYWHNNTPTNLKV